MKQVWRSIVGVWLLVWSLAWAGGAQLQQVTQVFDALHRSEAALAAGDTNRAQALLGDIQGAAKALERETQDYVNRAREQADRRQAEALVTTQRIDELYQQELLADKTVREREARIAELDAQLAQNSAVRTRLDADMAEYMREVKIRAECKAQPLEGMFYSWECWRLSFADVFARRVDALNNDIQDNARQRGALERERWAAMNERDGLLRNIEMLKSRKLEFQSQRAQLDSQVKTLRAAVTRLTDAVQFWRDMGVLIRSDIGTVDFLKDGVQRLAQRAGTEAPAPVFDRYDAETVRSLEQTLKDFAQSIDEGRNILLAPQG